MPGIERRSIYFDSCIAIHLVERREPWHGRIRARLGNLAESRPQVVYTDLNRLECRTAPLAWNRLDMLADYDAFFGTRGMVWHPLRSRIFDLATELRARHCLKTPDALHLAAAGRLEIVAFTD